jgi:hypothetical protein
LLRCGLHVLGSPFDTCGVAAEHFAERNRYGILQMGAPDFQNRRKLARLVFERGLKLSRAVDERRVIEQ